MINIVRSNLFDYKGQTVIGPWDRLKKHIFNSYPVVKTTRIDDNEELIKLAHEYVGQAEMLWVVDEDRPPRADFPWHYRPSDIGKDFIHTFPRCVKRTGRSVAWGDVRLVPTSGLAHGEAKNKIIAGYHEADFEIFMISFHEEEADANFQNLKSRFPDAKHVKNVEGIANAHKECARQAVTQMIYIVDADADVLDNFKFDYIPPMSKRKNTTYVWSARNPINGLEYGYGGIKLFPREQVLEMGHELPDFTTGVAFYQPISDVACYTRFNKDPYRTWRSAFRECVKLASRINPNQVDEQTQHRLDTWCNVDNGERFGRYCIKGANEGREYGEANRDNVEALNKINDYEWLREQFINNMKKKIRT